MIIFEHPEKFGLLAESENKAMDMLAREICYS